MGRQPDSRVFMKKLPSSNEVQHIVVLMLADIGDILVTTPSISALKDIYPDAYITVIVRSVFSELVAGHPSVDELVLLDKKNILTKLHFLVTLLGLRCDLFVDLHTPTFNTCTSNEDVFRRNAIVMKLIRAKYKLGYSVGPIAKLLTHPVEIPTDDQLRQENIVDTTLRIVGYEKQGKFKKIFDFDKSMVRSAKKLLADTNQKEGKFVAFFFGSKQSADIWPEDKVKGFVEHFLSTYDTYKLILLGGEYESRLAGDIINAIEPKLRSRIINLVARTSLQQTAACIDQCECMISTDSGPMHIADARAVPIVALFSSKNYPSIWAPIHSKTILLNKSVQCGPCFNDICNYDNECMALISIEEVMDAVSFLLKKRENAHCGESNQHFQLLNI